MNNKPVLIYDSECNLCTRFQKALALLDIKGKVSYRSLHDPSVYIDFPNLNKEDCEDVIHLVDSDGKIYRSTEVIEFLVEIFPGVNKFAWLLESDSAKNAMDVFYNKLNDMRIMKKRKCYTCGSGKKKQKRSL